MNAARRANGTMIWQLLLQYRLSININTPYASRQAPDKCLSTGKHGSWHRVLVALVESDMYYAMFNHVRQLHANIQYSPMTIDAVQSELR